MTVAVGSQELQAVPDRRHQRRSRATARTLRSWLPRGNMLRQGISMRRHRVITRLAFGQALGLGLLALILGRSSAGAAIAVLIPGLPAVVGVLTSLPRPVRTLSAVTSLMFTSSSLARLPADQVRSTGRSSTS